jgi:hypothetical protein
MSLLRELVTEQADDDYEAHRRRAAAGEFIPREVDDSTTRKIAKQLVTAAMKNYEGDDQLKQAKRMAKAFHDNLVKHIDEAYKEASIKKVKSG